MPYEIKTITTQPNRDVPFDFSDAVTHFFVGISRWSFTFGSNDHHVRRLEVSVVSARPTERRVNCRVNVRMQDDSGHDVVNASSSITLVCIAQTVANDFRVTISSVDAVQSGTSGGNIVLPDSKLAVAQPVLEGWNLAYSTDHHVKKVQVAAGFAQNGNTAQISAIAQMSDGSGNSASGSVDAWLFASTSSDIPLLTTSVLSAQSTGTVPPITFPRPIKDGAALIQGFSLAYRGDDHHIRTIGAGTSGWSVAGNSLILKDARAFMSDDSGNQQSNNESSVSLAVFAIPA